MASREVLETVLGSDEADEAVDRHAATINAWVSSKDRGKLTVGKRNAGYDRKAKDTWYDIVLTDER